MKRTMVVFALLLLVLKAWAGKITDDFEDGDFNGWKPSEFSGGEEAKWVVKDGKLVFISENFCWAGVALGIGDETWTDYDFSVDFSLKKTFPTGSGCWLPSFGITIHSDIGQTGTMRLDRNQWVSVYVANQKPDLGNDGWDRKGCEVRLGGLGLAPDPGEFAIDPRKWYTLRLGSRIEGEFTIYQAAINDTELCNFKILTPLAAGKRVNVGGVAIGIRNAEIHFDNVVIAGESIPDIDVNDFVPKPKLSVSRGGKLATTWGELKRHR